ncbi:hypothetical protein Ddye_026938 [Dipteronia dyeriana]|uniref:Uncharacterized protein n=1 Tax=Dipteronia dyeriana TaxID=168575 RepID=A0AAD9TNY1_9ROSI|nr:hypothetical protein Ddye_026938 [Dipteronia dyeriana]
MILGADIVMVVVGLWAVYLRPWMMRFAGEMVEVVSCALHSSTPVGSCVCLDLASAATSMILKSNSSLQQDGSLHSLRHLAIRNAKRKNKQRKQAPVGGEAARRRGVDRGGGKCSDSGTHSGEVQR